MLVGKYDYHRHTHTDCTLTLDHWDEVEDKIISKVKDLLPLELFEVIIRLDKNGLKNMDYSFFNKWNSEPYSIWEKRKLKSSLEFLINKPLCRVVTLPIY